MTKVRLISSKGTKKPRLPRPTAPRIFIGNEDQIGFAVGPHGASDGEDIRDVSSIIAHRLVGTGEWEYLTKKDEAEAEADELQRQREITPQP